MSGGIIETLEKLDTLTPSLKHITDGSMKIPAAELCPALQELPQAHIDSFNAALSLQNLRVLIRDILTEVSLPDDNTKKVRIYYKDIRVEKPTLDYGKKFEKYTNNKKLYPKECRMSGTSYLGKVTVQIGWKLNGAIQLSQEREIGSIPIMVKSDLCHLHGLKPKQLVARGEESQEFGGYFIVNGIEKMARILIQQRRNMPLAVKRPTWAAKRPNYTDTGVSMRCVRGDDQSISGHVLHSLTTGEAELSFRLGRQVFYIPVMLLLIALTDKPSDYIVKKLASCDEDYIKINAQNMLTILRIKDSITRRSEAIDFLGKSFKIKIPGETNEEVARNLIRKYICIHVDTDEDKFHVLLEMTRKLFRFTNKECCMENPDWLCFQEVLTPGHLYQLVFKECLSVYLQRLGTIIEKKAKNCITSEQIADFMNRWMGRMGDVTHEMTRWVSTGSVMARTDLGLTQTTGLTIVADKLNFMRYFSHFRSIHRGSYFQDTKTTEVRKLRPETFGFLCPTHTPDGSPCGLLLHMSAMCKVVSESSLVSVIEREMYDLGVYRYNCKLPESYSKYSLCYLDGRIVGWLHDSKITQVVQRLRQMKIQKESHFPDSIEICHIPKRRVAAQYPALYVFTAPGRLVRPVRNLTHDAIELIGTLEQTYLYIATSQKQVLTDPTYQYLEISLLGILSELASMTPFCDHNQSCRNMYQCQMAKQTMGVPLHSWNNRMDNKLYRLSYPEVPMVKTAMYDYLKMDEYPIGTNAVVAVMSYTGFDMEDAIAINEASYQRGFGHGSVIKTQIINLKEISGVKTSKVILLFESEGKDPGVNEKVDSDGLPHPGVLLEPKDPFYSYYNVETKQYTVVHYTSPEPAYVQQVTLTYNKEDDPNGPCQKVLVTLRIPRNPVIGDKFSSRHGQKGICRTFSVHNCASHSRCNVVSIYLMGHLYLGVFYPVEDMPFTLSGITPDIIFNPHGFPSRMTIGMMIEIMAGKSAAQLGVCHNASPFSYACGDEEGDDGKYAVDVFMDQLQKAGYNYCGTDIMICGTTGSPLMTHIFNGVVYYQRLRHMVLDKWQVRMTGPVDLKTLQPVGGRKRGGGIRFGEMERDALIAHGASKLLHDRLFNCSDRITMQACTQCGSLVSPIHCEPPPDALIQDPHHRCLVCERDDTIVNIDLPYITYVFMCHSAGLNLKTVLKIEQA